MSYDWWTKSAMRIFRTFVLFTFVTRSTTASGDTNVTTAGAGADGNRVAVAVGNIPTIDRLSETNSTTITEMNANHICTREEAYIEKVQKPTMQQFRVRTSKWCMEFPPRCSQYKTEFREVIKVQNVSKIRTIRYCCDGYAGITSTNETICKPICRGGCGRGYCESPDECQCDAGYTGTHCTQRCQHDRWGESCKNKCHCRNGSLCDNKLGICHCTAGWIGEMCELPCPHGYHGIMCRKQCDCKSNRCNPQSGDCDESLLPLHPLTFLPNDNNATSTMIETLNSTIVNITHNLDRIAKNLGTTDPTATLFVPNLIDATTLKPVQEVIVIKPGEHRAPSIIVHRPGGLGLLENIHSTAAKTPEVIHVITNWEDPKQTKNADGFANKNDTNSVLGTTPATTVTTATTTESTILTTMLIILLFILIFIVIGFLYLYWRYHYGNDCIRQHGTNTATATGAIDESTANSKTFSKPLPDLPAFTQMLHNRIEGPEFYDLPTNNAAVKGPYCYARKESIYSVIPAKLRKGSMDSHLYDEIRYPSHSHHHPHHHHHHHHPHYHNHQQHQLNQQCHQQQPQQLDHSNQPATQQQATETNNTLTVPSIEYHRISHM